MKKMILAVAAVAAVLSATDADAKTKHHKRNTNNVQIHEIYSDGSIDDVRGDLLDMGYDWRVKARRNKQIWTARDAMGEKVVVKLKSNDYKDFVKAKVDGDKSFVKDINPVNRNKHVAKLLEDNEKVVVRDASYDLDGYALAAMK